MILGKNIRILPKKDGNGLMAEIESQYKGLLKLSGLSDDKLNLVAGARYGSDISGADTPLNIGLVAGTRFCPNIKALLVPLIYRGQPRTATRRRSATPAPADQQTEQAAPPMAA